MNFAEAFSATIGKEAAAPAPEKKLPEAASFTQDDMKAYVDAKFEALKSDLISEMQNFKKVETPQETDKGSQENDNISQENIKKEEMNNASITDL